MTRPAQKSDDYRRFASRCNGTPTDGTAADERKTRYSVWLFRRAALSFQRTERNRIGFMLYGAKQTPPDGGFENNHRYAVHFF
jgi:hypothetical protein